MARDNQPQEEGSEPQPDHSWIKRLHDDVMECLVAPFGPMGWSVDTVYEDDDPEPLWNVHAYPLLIETVGGSADGEVSFYHFNVDIWGVVEILTAEEEADAEPSAIFATFNFPGHHSAFSAPNVQVDGLYEGRAVRLHIYCVPPPTAKAKLLQYPDGTIKVKRRRRKRRKKKDDDGDVKT